MRTYWLSLFIALPLFCSARAGTQVPLNNSGMNQVHTPETHVRPRLVELLTVEPRASIFYTYARETKMSQLFAKEATSGEAVALLVPTNRAVMALAKKPHQGSGKEAKVEGEVRISEGEFDRQSKRNVERWVAAHILPHAPIDFTQDSTLETLLRGTFVRFVIGEGEGEHWRRALVNGDVRILDVKEASNGWMYLIDGTVTPAE